MLSLVVACACDDEPVDYDLHGFEVVVPRGWTAEHTTDGPRQTLTLRPQPPVSFCQIVVIRDGRIFSEDDAQALLGDGLATFGGSTRRDVELDAEWGAMRGFALEDADPQPSWGLVGAGEMAEVEMYASPRRIRLLAAVMGSFAGAPGSAEDLDRCRGIVRSIR